MKNTFITFFFLFIYTLFSIPTALADQTDDQGATGPLGPPETLAIEHVRMEAAFAEAALENCSGFNAQELANCIGNALDTLADGLEDEVAKTFEPEAAKVVRETARRVRQSPTRAAIRNVIIKARRKIKSLAAKVDTARAAVFNRVSLVFKKALRVINKRS